MGFLVKEAAESVALHHQTAFLLKDKAQILVLSRIYALIIYLRQRVELFLQAFEAGSHLCVLEWRQLCKVDILRMNGKNADATVGIRVGPRVGGGGIVNGKHLQHALTGG